MSKIAVFARWPLALAAAGLTLLAVGLDLSDTNSALVGGAILVLASVAIGAFVYSEGVRHREYREQMNAAMLNDNADTQEET